VSGTTAPEELRPLRDIGYPGNQNRIVEKIVGSAVFLDDNDDMLDLSEGEWRDGVVACVKAK